MHRSLKPHAQAKKVPPPALPGDPPVQQHQQTAHYQQIPLYTLGRSNTAGKQQEDGIIMSSMVSSPSLEEGGFNLPREPSVALRMKDEIDYSSSMSGNAINTAAVVIGATAATNKPPTVTNPLLSGCQPAIVPCPPPVFCATLREPLTHKAAVYYHQQLALQEDQGIDLTQSPGRDSPGSSSGSAGSGSRHSTASLDSGRASSYLTGVSGASIRGSAGGALSSPRCSSLSSCSIGSVDRQRNDELIIDWLMDIKYEEYAQQFIAAGYDLPTIARMTPEDLTAIGIKNPHHRERIKQRIDKLQVLDNLPHFVPGSIEEWLQLLRLEEYIQPLLDQNYKTVRDVTQVTWEDLEDIGIVKLGHQKKILLAIKRVKDIISGKWNPGGPSAYHQQQEQRKMFQHIVPTPASPSYVPTARVSWDDSKIYSPTADAYYCTGSNHEGGNGNDIVLIKVRQPRGKSLESLEDIHDNSTRSHLTFSHYTTTDYGHYAHPAQLQQQQQQVALQQQQQQQHLQQQQHANTLLGAGNRLLAAPPPIGWRRSFDDGDITPTNDATRDLMYEEGGGTLPRQQRGILQRAMLNSMPPLEHHHYMNAAAAEYACHNVGLTAGTVTAAGVGVGVGVVGGNNGNFVTGTTVLDSAVPTAPYLTGSPMAQKKIAPEPPRRHCSIRNSRTLSGSDGMPSVNQHAQQQQQQQQQALHAQNMYYGTTPGANSQLSGLHHHHLHATGYIQQQQQQQQTQQPIYANYATIQQTTAEIHCEKFHDNKSNSSIDSIDTIPFANENTGTIKQRLLNRAEMNAHSPQMLQHQQSTPHLHSSSSSSSSSSTNTIANIAHSFHSLKSSASLHDGALISRSDSMGSNASGSSAGAATGSSYLRSPTLQYPATQESKSATATPCTITTIVDLHNTSGGVTKSPETESKEAVTVATKAAKVPANVLNDIGNMLANLTDELDAMLEEEKRVGLNIDSE